MKIEAEIIRVETTGDKLQVTMQGKSAGEAQWASLASQILSLPDTSTTRRAFHVGRHIEIVVKPKAEGRS